MRELLALKCEVCNNKNYTTDKNKKTMPDKLSIKKFCRKCRKHTVHSETKIK